MMKILKLLPIFIFFFSASCEAQHSQKLTLTVTLINHSSHVLTYTGVTDTNTENIFLVSPKVVLPGGTLRVTSVSNNDFQPDLSGNLHFAESDGKNVIYHLSDPHQLHIGLTTRARGSNRYLPLLFAHSGKPEISQST
jgi:hypothetical protein